MIIRNYYFKEYWLRRDFRESNFEARYQDVSKNQFWSHKIISKS